MRKLLAVSIIAVALMAACSNDDPNLAATDEPTATDAAATTAPAGTDSGGIQAGGDCTDNSKASGQADLEMQDFQFAPPCLQINTGQGLRLHNEGQAEHNFSVEGFEGLDVDVEPGEENNTEATGLKAGKYTFFCEYHRESKNMEGELRVVAA
jgi:plastocyanin